MFESYQKAYHKTNDYTIFSAFLEEIVAFKDADIVCLIFIHFVTLRQLSSINSTVL